ncbi:7260_t:CDS:1 [Gigaspora rosea]|nr:7260_t:CDS:1 [Gigaspora rosea]
MGYAKKALDYAFRADNVDEFVNYLEKFIERTKAEIDEESTENVIIGDPICVKHKRCQPKRYRSEDEDLPRKKKLQNIQDTSTGNVAKSFTCSSNAKSVRHCQNCRQTKQVIMHRAIQISANNDNCAIYRYVTYDSVV